MDWLEILVKALVAIAAVGGAIAAVFKWLASRQRSRSPSQSENRDTMPVGGPTIQAGRDVHFINNSFNKTTGKPNGG